MTEEKGTLIEIGPTQSGQKNGKVWNKMTFVISIADGKFKKNLAIDAWGEKIETVENIKIGSTVSVGFNVSSTEYKGKWYTNVMMVYIKNEDSDVTIGELTDKYESNTLTDSEIDDLPF